MAIRIENQYEGKLPKGAIEQIEEAFDSLPREHTRGLVLLHELVVFLFLPAAARYSPILPRLYPIRRIATTSPWRIVLLYTIVYIYRKVSERSYRNASER